MDQEISTLIRQKPSHLENKDIVIHYRIKFKDICLYALYIPLGALLICLVTAYIFQFDEVHETRCRVFNFVPSISAVVGVSPQRYFFRISVALHVGPRVIMSAVYNAYQLNMISPSAERILKYKARLLVNLAYFLDLIEVAAICVIAYISNRENYDIHEKAFITFLVSSLLHMMASIQGTELVAQTRKDLESVKVGLQYKKNILLLSLLCIAGIIIFFLQHRLLCFSMAFSMFSLCEYSLVAANVAFNMAIISDFPNEEIMVGRFIFPTGRSGDDNEVSSQKTK